MFKKTFLLFFVFYINTSIAQPPYSTIPFADDYKGKADLVIKSAKIKTQKTYFRLDEGIKDSILYIVRNYNAGGYLVNQKWYNLKSKKEMYSAHYEYDADNFFTNCVEKITKEFDDFDLFSRKITEDGFFINGTAENPLGETIPIDSEGNTVVKTIYQKDSLGGYVAKKYFQDDSFYKEKVCPFWDYGPKSYVGLFVNKNKTIDFFCSDKYYVADTLYNSIDTLNIRIKIELFGIKLGKDANSK